MGNTPSSASTITTTSASRYGSPPRPSTAGLPPSSTSTSSSSSSHHNLRKMKSSSTLSSLGRLYQHANHSSASVVSRISKSSGRPVHHHQQQQQQQHPHCERILDIGKPTQFEHGIHVEYNKDNGKYMGLPDVWQSNLPSDDVLNTNYINPNLVPSPANNHQYKKKPTPSVRSATTLSSSSSSSAIAGITTSPSTSSSITTNTHSSSTKKHHQHHHHHYDKKPSMIGKPYNIQHHVHVEVDQHGFKGLPLEWQKILHASGISEDIVNANPKAVQRLMHVRMPDSLQHQPPKKSTTKDTNNSTTTTTTTTITSSNNNNNNTHMTSPPPSGNKPPSLSSSSKHTTSNTTTPPSSTSDDKHLDDHSPTLPIGFAPPCRARHSKLPPLSCRHSSSSLASSQTSILDDPVTVKTDAATKTHLDLDSSFIDDIIDHADPTTLYTDFMLIAEGESGPMYAAKQTSTSRIVAIKKISKTAEQKPAKVRNELTTMKMSRHPNVVEFIACYTTETEVWVVMEYMDVALSDILSVEEPSNDDDDDDMMEDDQGKQRSTAPTTISSSGRLTEEQMARVARDLLRALGRLDRLGRIHRDLRSDNVLLNMRGEIKLTDFSQCAQLTPSQPKRHSVIGTPYWMAPEVIKGQPYDAKADIWSLGVLMIEMAQGDPPYVEYPPLRALFLIASNGLPAFNEPDRWSEHFKDFVHQCTTVEPSKRPDAATLLRHPFVSSVATKEDMVQLIEETRRLEELLNTEQADDDADDDNDQAP